MVSARGRTTKKGKKLKGAQENNKKIHFKSIIIFINHEACHQCLSLCHSWRSIICSIYSGHITSYVFLTDQIRLKRQFTVHYVPSHWKQSINLY